MYSDDFVQKTPTYEYLIALCVLIVFLFIIFMSSGRYDTNNIQTIVLEQHEYFKLPSYGGYYTLTHKANCKFCENRK